ASATARATCCDTERADKTDEQTDLDEPACVLVSEGRQQRVQVHHENLLTRKHAGAYRDMNAGRVRRMLARGSRCIRPEGGATLRARVVVLVAVLVAAAALVSVGIAAT